jgi:hypothetical protein
MPLGWWTLHENVNHIGVIKHVFINQQIPLTFFRSLISWENIDSFVILVVFVNFLPSFLIASTSLLKLGQFDDSFTYNLFQLLTHVNEFCNEKVNHKMKMRMETQNWRKQTSHSWKVCCTLFWWCGKNVMHLTT